MKDRVCLITGATSGIGMETARALALEGATIIAVGANPAKGAIAVERIRQETANSSISFLRADLSRQAEIRELAREFQSRFEQLDILINNAGGIFLKRQLTSEGIETTLALNYLGPFLLTSLLLDTLRANAPSRIINVSSGWERKTTINLDDLQCASKYNCIRAYSQSKLALIMFTYRLARQLEGTGVTVNALDPGFAATDIGKNNGWIGKLGNSLVKLAAPSPRTAAETSIYLASSPEVSHVTGSYFFRKNPVPSSAASYDEITSRVLWEISANMTGIDPFSYSHLEGG